MKVEPSIDRSGHRLQKFLSVFHKETPAWFIIAFILIILLRMWLASSLQLTPFASDPYDEGLFVRQAIQIVNGNWLGGYDELTLAKGPLYPLFVALSFLIGIRTLILQQWLYCFACVIGILALRPLIRSHIALLILFCLLLFNPVSLTSGSFTRILREGIYVSLILLVVASLIGSLLRVKLPLGHQLVWNIQLGIYYCLACITREERVWLTPLLLAGLGIFIWLTLRKHTRLFHILIQVGLPVMITLIGITTVKLVNYHYYQAFMITEFDDRAFKGAYGALVRVKPQVWQALIPVTKETRERIYPLSPAFNELEDYFEGNRAEKWTKAGESFKHNPVEIGGGWFVWALREAVAANGYYASYGEARDYYMRLSTEINDLCDSGQLDCSPSQYAIMPVWNTRYIQPVIKNIWLAIQQTAAFTDLKVNKTGCLGNLAHIQPFEAITGDVCAAPVDHYFIQGWAFSPEQPIEITVIQLGDFSVIKTITQYDSPDVFTRFSEQGSDFEHAKQARFQADISCYSACALDFSSNGTSLLSVPLSELVVGDLSRDDHLFAGIDDVTSVGINLKNLPHQYQLWRMKTLVITAITRFYHYVFPVLGSLAFVLFLFWLILAFRSKQISMLLLVDILLLLALFSRWGLLAYIHSSSFSGINIIYLSCVYALFILFSHINIAYWLENKQPPPGKKDEQTSNS